MKCQQLCHINEGAPILHNKVCAHENIIFAFIKYLHTAICAAFVCVAFILLPYCASAAHAASLIQPGSYGSDGEEVIFPINDRIWYHDTKNTGEYIFNSDTIIRTDYQGSIVMRPIDMDPETNISISVLDDKKLSLFSAGNSIISIGSYGKLKLQGGHLYMHMDGASESDFGIQHWGGTFAAINNQSVLIDGAYAGFMYEPYQKRGAKLDVDTETLKMENVHVGIYTEGGIDLIQNTDVEINADVVDISATLDDSTNRSAIRSLNYYDDDAPSDKININASDIVRLYGGHYSIDQWGRNETSITAPEINISGGNDGLYIRGNNLVTIQGDDITINGGARYGIYGRDYSNFSGNTFKLNAAENLSISGGQYGAYFYHHNDVSLTAGRSISLTGGYYGIAYVGADSAQREVSTIYAPYLAFGSNSYDGMYLNNVEMTVAAPESERAQLIDITGRRYGVHSLKNAYATLSAENIKVNGESRAVWASQGGAVDIDGKVAITSKNIDEESGSPALGIALAAGDDEWEGSALKDEDGNIIFDIEDGLRSKVNLSFENDSIIKGSIVSGYGGDISVSGKSQENILSFTGDTLAANGGRLHLELGNNGFWSGRADDYQDAANASWAEAHIGQFEPIFSDGVYSNGTVNINLGTGSTWNVTGQSWVSKIEGDGTIDLRGTDTGGYAIHIGEITGSNTFVVNIYNGEDRSKGDMIYVKNGTNISQYLRIHNREEVLNSMNVGDKVRFATVADAGYGFTADGISGSTSTFGGATSIDDAGMLNVMFAIEYEEYEDNVHNDKENDDAYNGGAEFEDSGAKPGTAYVESVYGEGNNAQNVYIVRLGTGEDPDDPEIPDAPSGPNEPEYSDAGRTILNMSRANYSSAVYMDRLNMRMGEARYFAEHDDGLWARVRHDRVGKNDAFLVQNTMFQVGYDRKFDDKGGTRRIGIAADYMRGSTEYGNILGDGDIDRFGIWLYSTWFGEKGHYTDYVLKWGRLSNEFDIYARSTGERITGDYDNNVFSASAEYGRKMEMGKGWYFEPQTQLQIARITDADYVTSQGTRVHADAINSLIGRVGFRLGKYFDAKKRSTAYIKADVLHEFLGDQDIHAMDATTNGDWLSVRYQNDDTWYTAGFGVSCKTGKNSYAFLDFEHSFGNDNDDSYQFSAGIQWHF